MEIAGGTVVLKEADDFSVYSFYSLQIIVQQ
jgi:hypothetical protein